MIVIGYFGAHNHTHYSNIRMLDSINKENQLIDRALELDMCGVAITDHESLGSHIKVLKYVKKIKAKAEETLKDNPDDKEAKKILKFKLGLGNEIYLTRDGLSKENYVKGQDGFWHFILIAKDKEGHKQLREISSRAWSHSFKQFMERVPTYYSDIEEVIGDNKGHLIASTACLGGQFPHMLVEAYQKENFIRVDNYIKWLVSIFGDDFYIEIQPAESKEQLTFNHLAVKYAKEHNIKYIVTTDTHYLRQEDRTIHKSFLNAGDGDREVDEFYAFCYMMDENEIVEHLTKTIELDDAMLALQNTTELYDKIEEYDLAQNQVIPRVPLDWNKISMFDSYFNAKRYDGIQKYFDSPYEEDNYFIRLIIQKLHELKLTDDEHLNRINDECEEMWVVSEKINERLSAYFLTVAKVIDIIWTDGDSLVGPWRGSVGALLTAYLLDITQRDPLKSPLELPYWRCISRGRAELADVDIDSQASKRETSIQAIKNYFHALGGEVVSVCTYGTETAKAAIQTAARGLGYDPEVGQYIASMIPIDRGFVRSFKQCEFGDEEKDFKPVKQFLDEVNKYPDIWKVAKQIEGLISHRGVHAAGVLITNNKFTEYGATMVSPKGQLTSQWDLGDSDYTGTIKFDMLTVDALDRERVTLELLSEHGYIEWQGSLKETYMKYLGPDVLDYENPEMWKMVSDNKIVGLFQWDTPVGLQSARTMRPESLAELAQGNSLMRLMPEGRDKTPTEEFAIFKERPSLLQREINSLDATEEEKKILYDFLKPYNGVLSDQEGLMLAVMLPFTQYSVDEANKVRKTVSKKLFKEIEKVRSDYYARGKEIGTSPDVTRYLWEVQAARQMGYSFSVIHSIAYSIIAIQEMNLAYKYPEVFWNAACLIVDSAGIEEEEDNGQITWDEPILRDAPVAGCRDFEIIERDEEELDEEEEEDIEDGDGVASKATKKAKKPVKYGKISSAIGKMRQAGITIRPPDVNKSKFTFVPEVETNSIIYGIKGITRINDELAEQIIENRPYNSLEDLMSKVKMTKLQIINLIKSGALDSICEDREKLMEDYILSIAGLKTKLTLQNMSGLINYGVVPSEYEDIVKVFNFNKFLKKNKFSDYYLLDTYCQEFFADRFDIDLLEINGEEARIYQKIWDKIYKSEMDKIRPWLANPETLTSLNRALINELWNKYCSGGVPKWEMDSIGFYNTIHELDGINLERYDIEDFYSLPEEPIVNTTFTTNDGKVIPLFKLSRIAGTVLERDKLKNTVTLLTPTGVVKVKIFKPQFVKYDRQLVDKDPITGKKKIIEKSWFTRGNKLVISGIRRDDLWFPKIYKKYKYDYPIGLITNIDYSQDMLTIITERAM